MDSQIPSDDTSSPPRKRSRREKSEKVLTPNVTDAVFPVSTPKKKRLSMRQAIEKDMKMKKIKIAEFMERADVFEVPKTYESFVKDASGSKHTIKSLKEDLDKICDEVLGPNTQSQCFSARFVDPNSKTLLAYFGYRVKKGEVSINPKPKNIADQYQGRDRQFLDFFNKMGHARNIVTDGLSSSQCAAYQHAAQGLCSAIPLARRFDYTRHEGGGTMTYHGPTVEKDPTAAEESSEKEQPEIESDEINPEAYEVEQGPEPNVKQEPAGVVHLVHGWVQQGQAQKGLFISSDISNTSTSLASAGSYYYLTQSIAETLACMFEAAFPEEYPKYRKAFEAGVWMSSDPGPFLGRAIIYKLQGRLHKDRHDLGPSACFGVGQYTGGEMLFPQFPSKFSYLPGHVCIFYSSIIFHKVSLFQPAAQTASQAKQDLTPGRIGSVFFFPKESYDILKDKPKQWGFQTAFGRLENIVSKMGEKEDLSEELEDNYDYEEEEEEDDEEE